MLGAVHDGTTKHFMYCDQPPCRAVVENAADVWRCGCVPDYIENVGLSCHVCGRLREHAAAVPE